MSQSKTKRSTRINNKPTTAKPDPIFVMIEKHKKAEAAFIVAMHAYNAITEGKRGDLLAEPRVWLGAKPYNRAELRTLRSNVMDEIESYFGSSPRFTVRRKLHGRGLFYK